MDDYTEAELWSLRRKDRLEQVIVVRSWPKQSGQYAYDKLLHGTRVSEKEIIRAMCVRCRKGKIRQCKDVLCPAFLWTAKDDVRRGGWKE